MKSRAQTHERQRAGPQADPGARGLAGPRFGPSFRKRGRLVHCDFPCSRSRVGGSTGPWVCVVLVMATRWGPSSRGSGQREEKGGAAASPRGRAGPRERERGRDTRQVRGEEAARPAGGGVDGGLRARGAGRAAGIVGWTVSTARAPLGASGRARPAGAPGSGPLPP